MISKLLNRLFEKKVIVNCERLPYLHRGYLWRGERLGIFVHKFMRSDEDRALHDHPWSFLVIPLWGGYVEHSDRDENSTAGTFSFPERTPAKRRVWPLISSRYRGTDYRHRVELIDGRPSWSLFFRFKKSREWGFWPSEGFVQWNRWWQDKCE